MSKTKSELNQIIDDKEWWDVITTLIPTWRLYGWSYRSGASFFTGDGHRDMLELSGNQRDAIVNAIQPLKDEVRRLTDIIPLKWNPSLTIEAYSYDRGDRYVGQVWRSDNGWEWCLRGLGKHGEAPTLEMAKICVEEAVK